MAGSRVEKARKNAQQNKEIIASKIQGWEVRESLRQDLPLPLGIPLSQTKKSD